MLSSTASPSTQQPAEPPPDEGGEEIEEEEEDDSGSEGSGDDGDDNEVEPPKVLGDLLESLAGAIFMDSGMDLKAVWDTLGPLFNEKIGTDPI